MLRGIYTAATGMIQQSRRLDTVSNNIANTNTTGYKKDLVVSRSFQDELLLRMDKDPTLLSKGIGPYSHGVYVDRVLISFLQGNLQQTERDLDFALQGSGFFAVDTGNGEAYTRDGSFTINPNGYLITTEGHTVMGENGPLQLDGQYFRVDTSGNVFGTGNEMNIDGTFTAGEVLIDRLKLVDFENPQQLEKTKNNLYFNTRGVEQQEYQGTVVQGYLEGSNVDALKEMVDMITASRNYESNQRVLKMMDETLGKTVNEVGRV